MKKNTSIKKSRLNGSLLIRSIILAVALFSLAGLVWVAYKSQESQKKVADIHLAIDKQIQVSNDLYKERLNQSYGVQSSNALDKIISKFDAAMTNSDQLQRSFFSSESAQQASVAKQWNVIKSDLQSSEGAQASDTNKQAVLKKISDLSSALHVLKADYTKSVKPITALPFSFLQLTIGLALVSLLFFGAWMLLQLTSSSRLQKEASRLQSEAVNRASRDQDAILRLMDDMGGLSEGDLTIEAQVTEDFTGAVADSVNFAVENMREMVGTIIHTSDEITKATENSQNVSRLLSDSSHEQSRQISTANETTTRMASSLHEIAENTDASVEIARSSVDIAQEGRSRVLSTIKSMTNIRENIQDTAKRIKRLGESSQEIGDIVEIIKGIADQTNVLALNAAIQATAAGEAGRGFAVVADEVQRLAERSANATKRIEVLVKTIQADANEAVASMENSTTQVVSGAGVAEEAGQSLDKIENVSQNLANLIINVSRATRNAAGMAGQVRQGMSKLSDLNQQSVRDVTTSVQSIDNLGELSVSLKESVSGFKLPS